MVTPIIPQSAIDALRQHRRGLLTDECLIWRYQTPAAGYVDDRYVPDNKSTPCRVRFIGANDRLNESMVPELRANIHFDVDVVVGPHDRVQIVQVEDLIYDGMLPLAFEITGEAMPTKVGLQVSGRQVQMDSVEPDADAEEIP